MTALRISIAAVTGFLFLSACAPDFNPPPGYQGGFLWSSDKSRRVTVEAGDTIYMISQRYDVPVKVVAARNALRPPYTLSAGQELILDPTRMHRVAQGETVATVARQYNLDASQVIAANDLRSPYELHADQELWIPDPFSVAAATPTPNEPYVVGQRQSSEPLPPVNGAPSTRGPAISVETLAPPPGSGVPEPGMFAAPQAPAPPAAASPAAPAVTASPQAVAPEAAPTPPPPPTNMAAAPSSAVPSPMASSLVPPPPAEAAPPVPPVAAPQVASIAPSTATEPTAPVATRFIWPLKGRLIAGFGPAGKGLNNDGIDIAAPLGTQVRAVENGWVAYAGSELKGFGNLLLIKHADGLTTAYAHNEKLLVTKGDTVKQGQVVATVGKTGNVEVPELHFEVRLGTQAVDPQEYLPQTKH